MIRSVIVLVIWATTATAQDFPAAYTVTNVAADDRLNIRGAPNSTADIIGNYGPYTLNIEVLRTSPDGNAVQSGCCTLDTNF